MITGGCFPSHDAIRYFDYELAGSIANAELAHNRGFFMGNCPMDLTAQISKAHEVLDRACRK
jgi:CDP-6-deoxy-D-xylo-4-hexulose-3-dehydrase